MTGRLIALELRQLRRDRTAWFVLLALCAASLLAAWNGRAALDRRLAGQAAATAEIGDALAAQRAKFDAPIKPEDAVLLPTRVQMPVILPAPPLMDASIGRAAHEPYAAAVGFRTREDTLFRRQPILNPELASRGSFDLAFVVTVLAPLCLIALAHGVFAGDRDSGAARLVLAQAGSPWRLLLARSLPRLALVAVPPLLALLMLLLTGPTLPGRGAAALGWTAAALLSLAFWWALILAVNSLRVSAETAALTLVTAWATLALVLPALIAGAAAALHPPPSRFAEIAAARAAEIAATQAYENDHADLAADDAAGRRASLMKSLAVQVGIQRATAPLEAAFRRQLGEQQRLVATLGYLAPPLVAHEAMAAAAGTDLAAVRAARDGAAAYLARLKAALARPVLTTAPFDRAAFDTLPRFTPATAPPASPAPLLWLAAVTAALLAFAARRFRAADTIEPAAPRAWA